MRWFQVLLPREDSLFDKFEAHARLLVKGAEALRELLDGGEGMAGATAAIIAHEEAADDITRDVFLAIRRTFITPFDRGDIRELTTALVWEDAAARFDEKALSALVIGIGAINLWNRINVTTRQVAGARQRQSAQAA
ncbi:MAG TPA: DUF47 family protein [Caulobacteraceae bacterium]